MAREVSLNAYTWNLLLGGSCAISHSIVLSVHCHFGEATLVSSDIFLRLTALTTVSASMLADPSIKIKTLSPPRVSPVRYCLLPSPINSRTLSPNSTSSIFAVSSSSFCTCSRSLSKFLGSSCMLFSFSSSSVIILLDIP